MFAKGDTVIYGTEGIFRIDEEREEDFGAGRRRYFVLKPETATGATTLFIPKDSEAVKNKMRRLLSSDEVHELIRSMPDEDDVWVDDKKLREKYFRELMESGDRRSLIRLTRAAYRRRQVLSEIGKKLNMTDESAMKQAEKMLFEEFALVLNIRLDEVLPMIIREIGTDVPDAVSPEPAI